MNRATADTIQVVAFNLVDESSKRKEGYAVQIEQVKEITQLNHITRVPMAPAHVKGVVNLRGKIISVIDMKELLGLHAGQPSAEARLLIVEMAGTLVGLLVDEVDQVLNVPAEDIESSPAEVLPSTQHVKGIAKAQGRLLVLLDLRKLLEELSTKVRRDT